jgi:hypothetical protein
MVDRRLSLSSDHFDALWTALICLGDFDSARFACERNDSSRLRYWAVALDSHHRAFLPLRAHQADKGVVTTSSSGTTDGTHGKNGIDLQNDRISFILADIANEWISRIWR